MSVILLDRDGTVIYEPSDHRVDHEDKIELLPDAIESLAYLAKHNYGVIFITNQAGIAEGRISYDDFWHLNDIIMEKLEQSGVRILETYMNGDGSGVKNHWRKPGPGMLLQAASDHHFDLNKVYMLGDRLSDVEAGSNAGAKTILIQTTEKNISTTDATYVAPTLLDAVTFAVSH